MSEPRTLQKRHLIVAARAAGLTGFDHKGIITKEKRGLLLCPRRPNSNWRVFNQTDIDGIVGAFREGGAGYWRFENTGR